MFFLIYENNILKFIFNIIISKKIKIKNLIQSKKKKFKRKKERVVDKHVLMLL